MAASTTEARRTRQVRRGASRKPRRPHIQMRFVTDGERSPGLELVEQLLQGGKRQQIELTPSIAEEAIEALEHLELPWLVDEMVESGERFAAQVHSRATRGLQEVVQNAEDQD